MSDKMSNVKIIPKLSSIEIKSELFIFDNNTLIISSDKTYKLSKYLQAMLKPATGFAFNIVNAKPKKNYIFLLLDDSINLPQEAYTLSSDADKIIICASGESGLFYGVQTLRQLLPTEIFNSKQVNTEWSVPAVVIKDSPRFAWRGLLLDTSRHYMPVDFIKKFIDLMAIHKMNTFHWHLTDDQGWRIEIKKYPRLTEVGAYRKETLIGHLLRDIPSKYDGQKYGDFYTQQQIKEIVQYAADRYINIVPEIEMPGHSLAALASYPELSCTGGPVEVATKWGVFDDVYCAGNEQTFTFIQDVLSEVIDLFPGKYIHIGGDECPKTRWEKCPKCQLRIKQENLENEHELQSYFIKRVEKVLNERGKTIIGWDEILQGGLAPNAIVMSWRGIEGGIAAAKASHYVIMTPGSYCYLDYYQEKKLAEPLAIGGYLPLKKVYSYDPVPNGFGELESKYILGLQGNIWTEYMKTPESVEYMAYPRAIAIAEVGWSKEPKKDFKDFSIRLNEDLKRLDQLNVNYKKNKPKKQIR